MDFKDLFDHRSTPGASKGDKEDAFNRDKFLARLFGIFSEKIVEIWAKDERAPYKNLGRPTVKQKTEENKRGSTYDFTLKERSTERVFVCEQKCELELHKHRYLELEDPEKQFKHMIGKEEDSFKKFLDVGKNPGKYIFSVNGERQRESISGIILIWGKVSENGRDKAIEMYNVYDVLSLEKIVNQLLSWKPEEYRKLIRDRQGWSNTFFENLAP
jgi:hypothetical protein